MRRIDSRVVASDPLPLRHSEPLFTLIRILVHRPCGVACEVLGISTTRHRDL